jgi:ribosomal-protein-alanine N-acetyltransferase
LNIIIKKARSDDSSIVSILENSIFDETYFKHYQETFLKNQSVLLAFDDRKIVGIIGWFEELDTAEIIMVGVDKDYRRLAIASMLMKACISMLLSKNIKKLFLEVRQSNSAAQNLYESIGFVLNRRRSNYYNDTKEDALEMRLDL